MCMSVCILIFWCCGKKMVIYVLTVFFVLMVLLVVLYVEVEAEQRRVGWVITEE